MLSKTASAARAALLGLAVGDALGVPVEFLSRAARRQDPVTGMRAFGTHHQPAGTWSDDSSLTFCLAETLARPGGRTARPTWPILPGAASTGCITLLDGDGRNL